MKNKARAPKPKTKTPTSDGENARRVLTIEELDQVTGGTGEYRQIDHAGW